MKKIFYIITIVVLASCANSRTDKEDGTADTPKLLTITQEKTRMLYDTLLFKSTILIKPETTDESLISHIDRVAMDDGMIFIFDQPQNRISVFGEDGTFRYNIHKIGQGPEEYIQATDFCLDPVNKKILLLCDRPYKVMYFSYDGKFERETATSQLNFQIATDGEWIYTETTTNKEGDKRLTFYNKELNVVDNGIEYMKTMQDGVLFSRGKTLSQNSGIYYAYQFDNNIYELKDGKLNKKYTFDFGMNTLPLSLLSKEMAYQDFSKECYENKYICCITDVIDNDNYLIFGTNVGVCFWDKRKDIFVYSHGIHNTEYNMSAGQLYAIGNNSNKVLSVIDPSILLRIAQIKKTRNIGDKQPNPKFEALADQLKEDDNPILLIHEFKN